MKTGAHGKEKSAWPFRLSTAAQAPVSMRGRLHRTFALPNQNLLRGERKLHGGGSDLGALAGRIHLVIGRFCTQYDASNKVVSTFVDGIIEAAR